MKPPVKYYRAFNHLAALAKHSVPLEAADYALLQDAVLNQDQAKVRHLMKEGLGVRQNAEGRNALLWAIQLDHVHLVEYLLDIIPDAMLRVDKNDNTALHLASTSPAMMAILLARLQTVRHRSQIHRRNKRGHLPIDIAAAHGHLRSVIDLLKIDDFSPLKRGTYILQTLTQCIRKGRLPRDINLSNLSLDDDSLAKIGPWLTDQGVEQLTISQNAFTHSSGKVLTVLLGENSHLQALDLSQMPLGGGWRWPLLSAVQHLARTLAHNQTLLRLTLSRTQMNDYDLLEMTRALEKNRTLESVDLTQNANLTLPARQALIQQAIDLQSGIDLKIEGITPEQQAQLDALKAQRHPKVPPAPKAPHLPVDPVLDSLHQLLQDLGQGQLPPLSQLEELEEELEIEVKSLKGKNEALEKTIDLRLKEVKTEREKLGKDFDEQVSKVTKLNSELDELKKNFNTLLSLMPPCVSQPLPQAAEGQGETTSTASTSTSSNNLANADPALPISDASSLQRDNSPTTSALLLRYGMNAQPSSLSVCSPQEEVDKEKCQDSYLNNQRK